jgi:BirA family biotin operon repressor/biotin-[acetyl-CoA-carboxylase] ligase
MAEDFWSKLLKARNGFVAFNEEEMGLLLDWEKRGYVFERHPFHGVRWLMAETQEFWCQEECEAWYREVGLTLPWHTKIFSSTGSTNDEAWLGFNKKQIQCGIYIAEQQTQGRGRRGRQWNSTSREGIYASLCVSIDKISLPISLVTLGVGVAIFNALKPWVTDGMSLKWPNDVLVNRKKICGVLTERQILSGELGSIVIGIGVNVSQKPEHWANDLREIATSLRSCAMGNRPIRRAEILARIIKECEQVFSLDADAILAAWSQRCLDMGKWIDVKQEQVTISGKLLGIDTDGALMLKNKEGIVEKIYSGDCVAC